MRHSFFAAVIGVFVCCFLSISLSGQQATSSQASLYLQQSLSRLEGSTSISDVTLTGSVRRIAGSDDESGTATLKAVSNGSARLDFDFPSGPSIEVSNLFAAPDGTWSGPDMLHHAIASHNLFAEPAWFFPTVAVGRRLSSNFVATYIGNEMLNGQAVEHISVVQSIPFPDTPRGPTRARLSKVDFYLDSTTLLPTALSFNVHPNNNSLLDIPVQVLFSDYRSVSGAHIPFHVQKFLNNSLILDLQFQSASINSGLSANTFSIQ